jgi:hypothetical protein
MLAVGLVLRTMPNANLEKIDILRIHMAVGISVLVLMLIRFFVRVLNVRPPRATIGNRFFDRIAPITHYGFYVIVVLMVVTGYSTAILASIPTIVFGHSGDALPQVHDLPNIYSSYAARGTSCALRRAACACGSISSVRETSRVVGADDLWTPFTGFTVFRGVKLGLLCRLRCESACSYRDANPAWFSTLAPSVSQDRSLCSRAVAVSTKNKASANTTHSIIKLASIPTWDIGRCVKVPAICVHQYANNPMSMIQWPSIQKARVPDALANIPRSSPAPKTMGTMPISAQSLVRWINMKKIDEIRMATTGPCRFSIGRCM